MRERERKRPVKLTHNVGNWKWKFLIWTENKNGSANEKSERRDSLYQQKWTNKGIFFDFDDAKEKEKKKQNGVTLIYIRCCVFAYFSLVDSFFALLLLPPPPPPSSRLPESFYARLRHRPTLDVDVCCDDDVVYGWTRSNAPNAKNENNEKIKKKKWQDCV